VPQPPRGDHQKLAIGRHVHDRLSHRERDDLHIGHASPGVPCPTGQKTVSRGAHGHEQHVEVAEHRDPPRADGATQAPTDIDLRLTSPPTTRRS
jgi:hypothetical protein